MAKPDTLIMRGTLAARPAYGIAGRLYYDTTNSILYRDSGSAWESVEGAGGMTNPMTTAGDIIYGGASGTPTRLAIGTASKVLAVNAGATAPEWVTPAAGGTGDGWNSDANTWSYSSADSPSFVISVNADMTGIIGVGMRIKLTQTTAKYFIVTAVGSYSGGATLITVYGGTDYTLANAAITSPYYSTARSPLGFPTDPAKWTQSASNTSIQQMNGNSPAQNTWYNSISLSIPIGAWVVFTYVNFQFQRASAGPIDAKTTLSTANNSESSNLNTGYFLSNSVVGMIADFEKRINLNLAAKATYYLNHLTTQTSSNVFQTRGDISPTLISAVCAYL